MEGSAVSKMKCVYCLLFAVWFGTISLGQNLRLKATGSPHALDSNTQAESCPPIPETELGGRPPNKKSIKNLKGQIFFLKPHKRAFGVPMFSEWNEREIYQTTVELAASGKVWISTDSEWEGTYFPSLDKYELKKVKVHKRKKDRRAYVETKFRSLTSGSELKLDFIGVSNFFRTLDRLFFANTGPVQSTAPYVEAITCRMVQWFREQTVGVEYGISDAEIGTYLKYLREFSVSGRPDILTKKGRVIPKILMWTTTSYNTLQVDRNERLASTISQVVPIARNAVRGANTRYPEALELIPAYAITWTVRAHTPSLKRFVDGTNHQWGVELIVEEPVMREYLDGDISLFSLVKKSKLRLDGELYELTTWEPIGAI